MHTHVVKDKQYDQYNVLNDFGRIVAIVPYAHDLGYAQDQAKGKQIAIAISKGLDNL